MAISACAGRAAKWGGTMKSSGWAHVRDPSTSFKAVTSGHTLKAYSCDDIGGSPSHKHLQTQRLHLVARNCLHRVSV
jgi:hypothetical protein